MMTKPKLRRYHAAVWDEPLVMEMSVAGRRRLPLSARRNWCAQCCRQRTGPDPRNDATADRAATARDVGGPMCCGITCTCRNRRWA